MVYYIVSVLFLLFFWCTCMAINVSIQYNGGLLPDIILCWPNVVSIGDGNNIEQGCQKNGNVFWNGNGRPPFCMFRSQLIPIWRHTKRWPSVPISKYVVPISLATDRGTRLHAMKRFCICSLRSYLNVLTFFPLTGRCSEGLGAFWFFLIFL